MSDHPPRRLQSLSTTTPEIRTAMVSTRRLAIVCPTPALDAQGRPEASRLDHQRARLSHLMRLWGARLSFRHRRLAQFAPRLVEMRMSVRLAVMKYRVKRRLKKS